MIKFINQENKTLRGYGDCIYFTAHNLSESPIKIGLTCDLSQRLSQSQTHYPHGIILLGLIQTPTTDIAKTLERHIHSILKAAGHWVRGEWFTDFIPSDFLSETCHNHFIQTSNKVDLYNIKLDKFNSYLIG